MRISTLFYLVAFFSLMSCHSGYQVLQLKSDQVDYSENNFSFVKDSLALYYDFWTEGGIPRITIENNGYQPVVFHMDRSEYLVNGNFFSYYYISGKEIKSLEKTNIDYSPFYYADPEIEILPGRYIVIEGFPSLFEPISIRETRSNQIDTMGSSPLVITNTLKYSRESSHQNLITIKHHFWASEIRHLGNSTMNIMLKSEEGPENGFFVKKTTDSELWYSIAVNLLELMSVITFAL